MSINLGASASVEIDYVKPDSGRFQQDVGKGANSRMIDFWLMGGDELSAVLIDRVRQHVRRIFI